jgi:hypothetical protein
MMRRYGFPRKARLSHVQPCRQSYLLIELIVDYLDFHMKTRKPTNITAIIDIEYGGLSSVGGH